MNKDQIKGKMKDMGGKVQEKAGELTGNKEQELKGNLNQAEGQVQEGYGDVKENVADKLNRKIDKDKPN